MSKFTILYRFNNHNYRTVITAKDGDEAKHKIYGMIRILSCKEEDTLDDIMELFNNAGIKL